MRKEHLESCLAVGLMLAGACGGPGDPASEEGGAETSSSGTTETGDGTTGETSTSATTESTGDTTESGTGTDEGFPADPPTVIFPRTRIAKEELAVLVNDDDPQSVAVAEYYVMAREIPEENVVHLSFPSGGTTMATGDFAPIKAQVDAALGDDIQALAVTWTTPYRVGCMSVTSAFAFGYDDKWCNTGGGGCSETADSPYYDSDSFAPWTDHQMRPAMMLAGSDSEKIFDLIDRGVASDDTQPFGDGYLIRTTDQARSVRWDVFVATRAYWDRPEGLALQYIDNSKGDGSNVLSNTDDVLFYFTGLANVADIETNTYLPGAVADHLTSFGGQVPTSSQMSIVAWLEAGATGSYGTVVEPCNYPTKFPNTFVMLPHYFRGQTLIEAYWKSVAWPGEGLFVGEPLAAPWDGHTVTYDPNTGLLEITTTLMRHATAYDVEEGESANGPWTKLFDGSIPKEQTLTFGIDGAKAPFYRIIESP